MRFYDGVITTENTRALYIHVFKSDASQWNDERLYSTRRRKARRFFFSLTGRSYFKIQL